MVDQDISSTLQERVREACDSGTALMIRGSNTKSFLGCAIEGDVLNVSAHRGITHYEPTELVLTARAGTTLRDIESALVEEQQMLAFEPPFYGDNATLGGTIACNLSGPRRAYAGAARDSILGTRIINGKGDILSFGGEVMKNVAGYDVSRLMAGAMGTLGALLEISLKVLPRPEYELTLSQVCGVQAALDLMHNLAQKPYPVSATCYDGERLVVRLSGTEGAVKAAHRAIGGDEVISASEFWRDIREHRHEFFSSTQPLWRLSVASDYGDIEKVRGHWLYEWGGALRWLVSDDDTSLIRSWAKEGGGHATRYRSNGDCDHVFQPLPVGHMSLHRKLKQAFDPRGILNPGRLYKDL